MVKGVLPYLRKTHKSRSEHNLEEKLDFNARLSILLTEITENNFGVRGVGFTVTYGMIGNLAGLIITYSIIIYQF